MKRQKANILIGISSRSQHRIIINHLQSTLLYYAPKNYDLVFLNRRIDNGLNIKVVYDLKEDFSNIDAVLYLQQQDEALLLPSLPVPYIIPSKKGRLEKKFVFLEHPYYIKNDIDYKRAIGTGIIKILEFLSGKYRMNENDVVRFYSKTNNMNQYYVIHNIVSLLSFSEKKHLLQKKKNVKTIIYLNDCGKVVDEKLGGKDMNSLDTFINKLGIYGQSHFQKLKKKKQSKVNCAVNLHYCKIENTKERDEEGNSKMNMFVRIPTQFIKFFYYESSKMIKDKLKKYSELRKIMKM